MKLRAVALAGSALVLAACGSVADQAQAPVTQPLTPQARCEAALVQMPSSDRALLVMVFESTALEVAAWEESGLMPGHNRAGKGMSPLRKHPIDESVASCYYDGAFVFRGPRPAPMPGAPSPPPEISERLLLIIDGAGDTIAALGGSKEYLPLVRPAA